MPDVVIVGGGIIGAACAYELARDGVSVELIERAELAAGASGRNAGLWARPTDPALQTVAESSLAAYLAIADDAPIPFNLDPRPIGTVLVPMEKRETEASSDIEAYLSLGVRVDELDAPALRSLEPALDPEFEHGWLVDDAHRLDPAPLTVSLALMAVASGARIRHHVPVRALVANGDRVRGVVTDDGTIGSDVVVVAAGPWSPAVLESIGGRVPVLPARGWLVRLDAPPALLHHELGEGGWRESLERSEAIHPVPARELAAGHLPGSVGLLLGPHLRAGVQVGASRQSAVTPEPEDPSMPSRLAAEAIRLVPSLADAAVMGSWWGLRPMTPDERPLVGTLMDGLIVATGHGSEGVILGAGTAQLVASMIGDREPPFDPTPFDPHRFD